MVSSAAASWPYDERHHGADGDDAREHLEDAVQHLLGGIVRIDTDVPHSILRASAKKCRRPAFRIRAKQRSAVPLYFARAHQRRPHSSDNGSTRRSLTNTRKTLLWCAPSPAAPAPLTGRQLSIWGKTGASFPSATMPDSTMPRRRLSSTTQREYSHPLPAAGIAD